MTTYHFIFLSSTEIKIVSGLPKRLSSRYCNDLNCDDCNIEYQDEVNKCGSSAPYVKNIELAKDILYSNFPSLTRLPIEYNHLYPVDLSGFVVSKPEEHCANKKHNGQCDECFKGGSCAMRTFVTITKEEIREASEKLGWDGTIDGNGPDALNWKWYLKGLTHGADHVRSKEMLPVAAPLESKALEVPSDSEISCMAALTVNIEDSDVAKIIHKAAFETGAKWVRDGLSSPPSSLNETQEELWKEVTKYINMGYEFRQNDSEASLFHPDTEHYVLEQGHGLEPIIKVLSRMRFHHNP